MRRTYGLGAAIAIHLRHESNPAEPSCPSEVGRLVVAARHALDELRGGRMGWFDTVGDLMSALAPFEEDPRRGPGVGSGG